MTTNEQQGAAISFTMMEVHERNNPTINGKLVELYARMQQRFPHMSMTMIQQGIRRMAAGMEP